MQMLRKALASAKERVDTLHVIRIRKEKMERENGREDLSFLHLISQKKKKTLEWEMSYFLLLLLKVSSRTDGGYSVIDRYKCLVVTVKAISSHLK